jgi:hypothetical protein
MCITLMQGSVSYRLDSPLTLSSNIITTLYGCNSDREDRIGTCKGIGSMLCGVRIVAPVSPDWTLPSRRSLPHWRLLVHDPEATFGGYLRFSLGSLGMQSAS